MKRFFLKGMVLTALLGTLFVISCDPGTEPNIPPTANLDFQVVNTSFQPLEGARVYLFPFKSLYDTYLQENPLGTGSIQPNLNSRNIGLTDSVGTFLFENYDLQGSAFSSGNTWVHRPDPLFFRIEATLVSGSDTLYLTNDGQTNSLTFGELDNALLVTEEIEVIVE